MKKELLSLMVQLADIDGEQADAEMDLIYKIGDEKGLSKDEIDEVVKNPIEVDTKEVASSFSEDERFDWIYHIILLMKIDGKLKHNEMLFCSKVADALGYNSAMVFEAIGKVNNSPDRKKDKALVKDLIQGHLK